MDAQLREFGYVTKDEERGNTARNVGIGAGGAAVAGGAAYGGKKLRNAVINRAGAVDDYGNLVARKGMYQDAGKKLVAEGKAGAVKVGKAAAESGKEAARKGLGKTGRKLIKAGGEKGGLLRNVGQKLTKAARAFDAGQVNLIAHLAERIAVLELEAEEEVRGFALPEGYYSQYPLVAKEHRGKLREDRAKGVAVGAGALGVAGAGAYGAKKLNNAVINRAGAVDDYGNMVARKGMYKDAGKQVYGQAKKKAGAMAADATGQLEKVKSGLVARFAKKTAGFIG